MNTAMTTLIGLSLMGSAAFAIDVPLYKCELRKNGLSRAIGHVVIDKSLATETHTLELSDDSSGFGAPNYRGLVWAQAGRPLGLRLDFQNEVLAVELGAGDVVALEDSSGPDKVKLTCTLVK